MTWNVFMERHDRWSGATLRSRIYALKDIGTNDEVIAMVSEMPEERYKAQLVRKAIKLGNIFTDGDIEKLKDVLAASTYEEVFVNPVEDDEEETVAATNEICLEDDDDEDYEDIEESCGEPSRHRVRIFTKRNKVMDALAKLFGLPVPPEKKTILCGCPYNCDECPRKKSKATK